MSAPPKLLREPLPPRAPARTWLTSTDHKRIGILIMGTALVVFFLMGALAMVIRYQLATPGNAFLDNSTYNEVFTIHGSGMIYLVMTPFGIGLGLYLIPLHIGAPNVSAPRLTMTGYWFYVLGAFSMIVSFATTNGAAKTSWTNYAPLSDSRYQPGMGENLWLLGTFLAVLGMLLVAATVLWTVLTKRIRGMSMFRIPMFDWAIIVTNLLAVGAFLSLMGADALVAVGRVHPAIFSHDVWVIGYQNLFWFYGHPVVYVMFFPYVGCVDEVLATFSGRRFFGYRINALALLAFAALSMSVWGHHMFVTGENANDYFSFVSIALIVPAGVEYFDFLATIVGGRLRYPTGMLFALAFIPQFLIGGLTGIMTGTTVVDYQINGSFFIVAHFHYTLLAGSFFGLLAGFYFWYPKITGLMLSEKLGKVHFWLMVIGTNVTFLPQFVLGMKGMPRRVATYLPSDGFTTLNEISSIGAGVLAVAMSIFVFNIVNSMLRKVPAGDDPWGGFTLEWATSSPPPKLNFPPGSIPPITSFAPLLDKKLREQEQAKQGAGAGARGGAET